MTDRSLHEKVEAELFRFPRDRVDRFANLLVEVLEAENASKDTAAQWATTYTPKLRRWQNDVAKYSKRIFDFTQTHHLYLAHEKLLRGDGSLERAIRLALNALTVLEKEIAKNVERTRRPASRPRVAYSHWELIAICYQELLGQKPTSTIGSHFYNIVLIARSHQRGRRVRDVSREVRAALRSMRRKPVR